MVSLATVRNHNASLKSLPSNLVAVFVGGTAGIGLSTAREFARNTSSPRIYLIGRNQTEATRLISELQSINSTSKVSFIQSNVSLLKEVDKACSQIKAQESKLNLLFLTVGQFTMAGRVETPEGLDRKFSLHFYARLRFVQQLSPLLQSAADDANPAASLSRVVAVLDPKLGNSLNFADLSLKHNFSLRNCGSHASAMTNFAFEHWAKQLLRTSFVHEYPGFVRTNLSRDLGPVMGAAWKVMGVLLKPMEIDVRESGERHLFAATAARYAPRGKKEGVGGVAMGGDSVVGSGAYRLNWDGEVLGESTGSKTLRREGAVERTWNHTEEVFKSICEGEGKYQA